MNQSGRLDARMKSTLNPGLFKLEKQQTPVDNISSNNKIWGSNLCSMFIISMLWLKDRHNLFKWKSFSRRKQLQYYIIWLSESIYFVVLHAATNALVRQRPWGNVIAKSPSASPEGWGTTRCCVKSEKESVHTDGHAEWIQSCNTIFTPVQRKFLFFYEHNQSTEQKPEPTWIHRVALFWQSAKYVTCALFAEIFID